MARSELNSLLDVAARRAPDDDGNDGDGGAGGLYGYSEEELREEIERRRKAREEVEEAIHGRRYPEPNDRGRTGAGGGAGRAGGGPTGRSSGERPRHAPAGGSSIAADALRVQKAYAALEVPPGSDFETVRRAYRTLMRKYHPDRHTSSSPEKQKAANEVAQRLTESYKLLEKTLRR